VQVLAVFAFVQAPCSDTVQVCGADPLKLKILCSSPGYVPGTAEWCVQIHAKQLRKQLFLIFGGRRVTGGARCQRTVNQEYLAPPKSQKTKNLLDMVL
jgi:hypothetical protein